GDDGLGARRLRRARADRSARTGGEDLRGVGYPERQGRSRRPLLQIRRLPDRPARPARRGRRRHARTGRRGERSDERAVPRHRGGLVTALVTVPPPPASRDLARMSDEALLSLVASSDEDALAALYDRFGRIAYGLALRILRDPALAPDAVHEAFLGVWRNAGRFLAERAKASTWILTLVHRRAVDLVRREDIRRGEPLERAPEAADATT